MMLPEYPHGDPADIDRSEQEELEMLQEESMGLAFYGPDDVKKIQNAFCIHYGCGTPRYQDEDTCLAHSKKPYNQSYRVALGE